MDKLHHAIPGLVVDNGDYTVEIEGISALRLYVQIMRTYFVYRFYATFILQSSIEWSNFLCLSAAGTYNTCISVEEE